MTPKSSPRTSAASAWADGVLMWDLGMNKTTEDLTAVVRTSDSLRSYDVRRPRANIWDGFSAYSESLNVIGSHRWPPSLRILNLNQYREWLDGLLRP